MHRVVLFLGKSRGYSNIGPNRTNEGLVLQLNDTLEDLVKMAIASNVPVEQTITSWRRRLLRKDREERSRENAALIQLSYTFNSLTMCQAQK